MVLQVTLGFIIVLILAIIISALPLYFAVLLLGGDATILKVLLTNVIVALGVGALVAFFSIGSLGTLLIVILIYKFMFDLGIIKAFFAWILQYVVAVLLVLLAVFLFGITIPLVI